MAGVALVLGPRPVESRMKSVEVSFSALPRFELVGIVQHRGTVFFNDLPLVRFDSRKSAGLQTPLSPLYFKKGLQNFRIQLDSSSLGLPLEENKFHLRWAGFRTGDFPALTEEETSRPNPFGDFPVWGEEILRITARDFGVRGEARAAGGIWRGASALDGLDTLDGDEATAADAGAFIDRVQRAVQTGDADFLWEVLSCKIRSGISPAVSDAGAALEEERRDLAARTRARPTQPGFEMLPLPAAGLRFRSAADRKILVVEENTPVVCWKTEKVPEGCLPFFLAKQAGRWILF